MSQVQYVIHGYSRVMTLVKNVSVKYEYSTVKYGTDLGSITSQKISRGIIYVLSFKFFHLGGAFY